jgi:hypothetical protein
MAPPSRISEPTHSSTMSGTLTSFPEDGAGVTGAVVGAVVGAAVVAAVVVGAAVVGAAVVGVEDV